MALLFHDGFDNYNVFTTDARTNGWSISTNVDVGTIAPGRFGGRAASFASFGNPVTGYLLDIAQATVITGFAVYFDASSTDRPSPLLAFYDADDVVQVYILANLSGQRLDIYSGNNVLIAATSNGSFFPLFWEFVEVKLTVGTSGSLQIKINNSDALNVSGINTQGLALGTVNKIAIIPSVETTVSIQRYNTYADDFYVCDTTTGPGTFPCNDFLGDCRVITLFPTANGSVIEFDTTAASNFEAVNSFNPQSNTVFNSSQAVGDEDLFTITAGLTSQNDILGLRNMSMARNSDAGTRTLATEIKSGATTNVGPSVSLGATRQYVTNQMPINPITSASWTFTEVNALQIGYTITA